MDIMNLFLYGEDAIDDVKQIRLDAIAAIAKGRIVEWSSDSVSVKKVLGLPLEMVIGECNYFLRLYEPTIAKNNPIYTQTKPNLLFT
jgi:hypothetical protein